MNKPVILTGLRANNDLHIGNYFGALLPIVDMAKNKSDEYQVNLFVPDLHSITVPIEHFDLQKQIMSNIKTFIAAGLPLDNRDIHLYRQSFIPAHSELAWILDCFTGFGEMSRMTQFKDKAKKLTSDTGLDHKSADETIKGSISVGVFNYPVLMAADILLYGAKYVPVGEDQTQHLEFTRDVAQRINSRLNEDVFVIPEPVKKQHEFFGKDQGLRIKDLADPSKKMSKSDESDKGVIFLSDSPKNAHKKIMSATTDDVGEVKDDPMSQPGIANLIQIYKLLSSGTNQPVETYIGMKSYGDFKKIVADATAKFLEDFQNRLNKVDEKLIEKKLESSEKTMNAQANKTLLEVQKCVGLR